ncbi:IS4 family transposase [Aggregicoccus sp. 17bor-14]|uniref:IS4 family transposase n=1 Tax=Myxococcaceae TaxID=31 RepID=UPI00129CF55D|nr:MULTISPECIES: IS4 family transposase [Myxococcaceae]MBF5046005.1 IS4 family transposase [Simulacricoccus sp. 17bor-14]MRI91736.1 IS4 family transposase [Aggregicoccus sp. 17bor-14]
MGLLLRDEGPRRWAQEEFESLELGHALREASVRKLAAGARAAPHGRLTQVFEEGPALQSAYRCLENPRVSALAVGRAAWAACVQRACSRGFATLIVPLDQSTLSLADAHRTRGLGPVGKRSAGARGLEVMTALGVAPTGEVLGLLGQAYWKRDERAPARPACTRPLARKETRYWLHVAARAVAAARTAPGRLRLWLQMDRGADFHEALAWADSVRARHDVTIRAAHERRCLAPEEGYLWDCVEASEVLARTSVYVPARHGEPSRWAHVEVRSSPVLLQLKDRRTGRKGAVVLTAVQVREVGHTGGPKRKPARPLHWLLLTTREVQGTEDALAVLQAYCLRWRVEDFHRAWKGGACHVQDTQLHHRRAILTWASLLASVATQAEALKTRGTEEPDAPATEVLSVQQLRAALLLRGSEDVSEEAARELTLLDAKVLIGRLGGWTGYYSGAPPGTQTLMRGLERVNVAAQTLDAYERLHPPERG